MQSPRLEWDPALGWYAPEQLLPVDVEKEYFQFVFIPFNTDNLATVGHWVLI